MGSGGAANAIIDGLAAIRIIRRRDCGGGWSIVCAIYGSCCFYQGIP